MYASNSLCSTNPIYERSSSVNVNSPLSDIITYIALIIIAILAIPFLILAGLILVIWTLADKILSYIDTKNAF